MFMLMTETPVHYELPADVLKLLLFSVLSAPLLMTWIVTSTVVTGLEGVPFALGARVQLLSATEGPSGGPGRRIRLKTAQELNAEYQYSFFTERSAILRL